MATLALKISVVDSSVVKTMQFEPTTTVYDACRIIREKLPEFNGNPSEYSLFLSDDDPKKGIWLESSRNLEYYLLRNGDMLEYKKKIRQVKVKTLDDTVKTVQIDDSHSVGQLMITVCLKIGITNHDEYSLVRELSDEDRSKTLTLRRDKSIAKDQKKLDEMKKKLHTDDELEWLDHGKTLREQGVDPAEVLLLRRKYFFSDQNVDARDPIQLNLLYIQMRDAILKGAHPVNQEEAIKFAGYQCQVQFGDHRSDKHKSGFIELKEFLPKEYTKVKGIEKKIYQEHKNIVGMSDVEAKWRYTQLARSLKTYGITFFLVKEKMKGKNKLVPRLLGINKDSVVRVDENTKEILTTYKLTTVKRWAASPNSFTLDLGDYADSYYAVQTTEGEQISQLIAGYIDIILKKQGPKDHLGIEGDEDSTMYEDSVAPAKATIMQLHTTQVGHADTSVVALPGVLRVGEGGMGGGAQFSLGSMQPAQFGSTSQRAQFGGHLAPIISQNQSAQTHALGQAQRALMGIISDGLEAIKQAQNNFDEPDQAPQLGSDPAALKWREGQCDLSKQRLNAELSAMSAATAQIVSLTSVGVESMDYVATGAAMQSITMNMIEFSHDINKLASLSDGSRFQLMDAARRLAGAFTDLLTVAQPGSGESRQALVNAATRIAEVTNEVVSSIEPESAVEREFKERLIGLAKSIATVTASLVMAAKGASAACDGQAEQNRIIGSATQCAVNASQLVTCTKIVAPTLMTSTECQEQLVDAAKQVAGYVDNVVQITEEVCPDDQAVAVLGQAATSVTKTLDEFVQHIRYGTIGPQVAQMKDIKTILLASEQLFVRSGDTAEMVSQVRILAQATSQLSNALKLEATTESDPISQTKLLTAAKLLADATARMVEAAKEKTDGCASKPLSKEYQDELKRTVEELRSATNVVMTSEAMQLQALSNLQQACKRAASSATHLINVSTTASKSITNPQSQAQLNKQTRTVADETIPHIVQALRAVVRLRPGDDTTSGQLALISAAQEMIQSGGSLLSTVQTVQPTVSDQSAVVGLTNSSRSMASALSDLSAAVGQLRDIMTSQPARQSAIQAAVDQVEAMQNELVGVRKSLIDGSLVPLPGESVESSSAQLGAVSKTLGSAMAQLLTAAAQGNADDTDSAARSTVDALRQLLAATRGIVATTAACRQTSANGATVSSDDVLNSTGDVLDKSLSLLTTAKLCIDDPQNPENKARLAQVAKSASMSLNGCVNCLPGIRDVDQVAKYVTTVTIKLTQSTSSTQKLPAAKINIVQARSLLKDRADQLNQAASDVAAAAAVANTTSSSTAQLQQQNLTPALHRFSQAYEDFVSCGLETTSAAAAAGDTAVQNEVVSGLRSVSTVASRLLIAAKSVLVNPNAPDARNQLTIAARAVTDSINQLITVCTVSSAPGQKECDAAIRQLQASYPMLENPCQPVTDGKYLDSLEQVAGKAKMLAESLTGISTQVKQGNVPAFNAAVSDLANTVCAIAENSAQAAYLVGIADPASVPGRPGVVDQLALDRSTEAINTACQTLADTSSSPQQVHAAITLIGTQTGSLCNVCRTASAKIENPVARRQFVQLAKDIANSTIGLVQAVKDLDKSKTKENHQRCADASQPLLRNMELFATLAASSDYCAVPAVISDKARVAQMPITASAKAVVESAVGIVEAAKQLAANPQDPGAHQKYAMQSRGLSEAIKNTVLTIRDGAPGQRECDAALQSMDSWINVFDQASLAAVGQNLASTQEGSLTGFQEQVLSSAKQLLNQIEPLRMAAKGQTDNLHHLVTSACCYVEPLTIGAVNCASRTVNSKQQMTLLDQSKTVVESMHNLVTACKSAGCNAKAAHAAHTFGAVDEAANSARESLQELIETLERAAAASGLMTSLLQNITHAISMVASGKDSNQQMTAEASEVPSYVDCQTNIVRLTKQVAQTVQEMMSKALQNPQELSALSNTLSRDYTNLATESCRITLACSSSPVTVNIRSAVQQLGTSCIELIQDVGSLQSNPNAGYVRRDITVHSKKVLENISEVVMAVQSGSRGTQACINASSTISGIIADLDTTIMFAAAGTLNADQGQSFANHRDGILKTAKELVDNAKSLVVGAASSQDHLVTAANSSVEAISRLTECVKLGAAALGSHQPDAQVMLLNAIKDAAAALIDLIETSKNAAGKPVTDPSMTVLKESAQKMVTNVTSLLKTVKTVEDETARGTQALESSIEAISQEAKVTMSVERSEQKITPDDLLLLTRPITMATVKAVAAGNSGRQEDIIAAANLGRKAVSDLLRGCRTSLAGVSDVVIQRQVQESGNKCALAYRDLLRQIYTVIQSSTVENKQYLVVLSKSVASAVAELIQAVEAVKGTEWVDPTDPTVIAENELLSAANSIEAAAKKLAQLQPRQRPKQADETLNFEEQILEAAKSIAAATAALVKAASVAQKELVAQGRIGTISPDIDEESQWSQGLISAARLVAVATHSLCDAANAMVQGQASEEKLISSAKQVAASTAQLLVACQVKASPNSTAMKRLQSAGNAVKRATEALVREAQNKTRTGLETGNDDIDAAVGGSGVSVSVGGRMVTDMAKIIAAQEEILKKEKELEAARENLKKIRQKNYLPMSGPESPGTPSTARGRAAPPFS